MEVMLDPGLLGYPMEVMLDPGLLGYPMEVMLDPGLLGYPMEVMWLQACLPGKVLNRYLQGQKSGFDMKNRYKSFKT